LIPGQYRRLDNFLSATVADGDAVTQVELWDHRGGDDSWWIGSTPIDAQNGYVTDDLDDIWIRGSSAPSEQNLWVRAHDGTDWSAWKYFTLITRLENRAPEIEVEDQALSPSPFRRLDDVLSVSDADADPMVQVELWDSSGGDDNWWVGNTRIDASGGYVTGDLDNVWFRGPDAPGQQKLWVRAHDGTVWSDWDVFSLDTI